MYQSPNKKIWTGRNDPFDGEDGHLWHHVVEVVDMEKNLVPAAHPNQVAILGFASDEGVKRNQGRPGAKDGPDVIRKAMCNLAVHFNNDELMIKDVGNVVTVKSKLEEAQKELSEKVTTLLGAGYFPILLGGGHEIAYGHYNGIYEFVKDKPKRNIGVINFDAHFDFRSYANGAHSGSPFRQIVDDCEERGEQIHYLPIGINQAANQRAQFKVMEIYNQTYIPLEEVRIDTIEEIKMRILGFAARMDYIYITLDLDVMSMGFSPGVSAPAAFGVFPYLVRGMIKTILGTGKVISFDVAEFNPTYDDGRTAKLAASFVYDVAMSRKKKEKS
ncbi:formimidoylglutamase [Marinoscillum sp. 108]|uniref:formimidoylglutamase n=1 Tax=Marinoscillum sp. 108 TaxID=2653151 RepID=UPI0012F1CA7D|nr:formimidoylglutamase [Marinoscillum sp. 108]VXD20642.1 Formimidoylglutamase [Marinoscillum sp. 108]